METCSHSIGEERRRNEVRAANSCTRPLRNTILLTAFSERLLLCDSPGYWYLAAVSVISVMLHGMTPSWV